MDLPVTRRHPQALFLPRSYVCYRTASPPTIAASAGSSTSCLLIAHPLRRAPT